MPTTPPTHATDPNLGIYPDRSALDHDAAMLVESLVSDFEVRGVRRADALASVRRVLRGVR